MTEDPKKRSEKSRLMKSIVWMAKNEGNLSSKKTVPVDRFFCILNHQPVVFCNISKLKEGAIKIMYTMCEKIASIIN